jgi:hypothetical protein
MSFVYLHRHLTSPWIARLRERAMANTYAHRVTQAIFLSTFVMIGQNRQAAFQQAESDRDYQDVNTLLVEEHEPHPRRERDDHHRGCTSTSWATEAS